MCPRNRLWLHRESDRSRVSGQLPEELFKLRSPRLTALSRWPSELPAPRLRGSAAGFVAAGWLARPFASPPSASLLRVSAHARLGPRRSLFSLPPTLQFRSPPRAFSSCLCAQRPAIQPCASPSRALRVFRLRALRLRALRLRALRPMAPRLRVCCPRALRLRPCRPARSSAARARRLVL